jgi:tRNA threonylcarbamoyladenosine biosynthesis protein TsaB
VLLAIDTSTTQAGIALYNGSVLAEMVWQAGRDHGRLLLPTVERTLELVGHRVTDLSALAVARGPGSFTGLRVGLSAAKGLQLALGVPLYGFGSLDIVVYGHPLAGRIQGVLAMGRGRFATGLYERSESGFRQVGDTVGVDSQSLVGTVIDPVAVVGDVDDAMTSMLLAAGHAVYVSSPALGMRRPAVLAELGWNAFKAGKTPEPDAGEPIYLARG